MVQGGEEQGALLHQELAPLGGGEGLVVGPGAGGSGGGMVAAKRGPLFYWRHPANLAMPAHTKQRRLNQGCYTIVDSGWNRAAAWSIIRWGVGVVMSRQ